MWKNILIIVVVVGIVVFLGMQGEKTNKKNSEMLSSEGVPVKNKEVSYFENVKGFYAYPKAQGVYPGVVMIHEWWGLNENIKDMARELAGEGYRVIAVDLFGKIATTPEEARAQTSALDQEKALMNLKSAVSYLRAEGSPKIASLGWCFGGGQSLQLSLSGEDLSATVIYYGQVVSEKTKLEKIKWPVLGIFGAKDTSIPVEKVNDFRKMLTSLNIENSINEYPEVGHAFANPSGANYAPNETKDAWVKTLIFLEKNLK